MLTEKREDHNVTLTWKFIVLFLSFYLLRAPALFGMGGGEGAFMRQKGVNSAESGSGLKRQGQPMYAASPNHRQIAVKAFELATQAGFLDTVGITSQEIQDRLEAGAYSEDYDSIPGIVGEHFPDPWTQGPTIEFNGLYPTTPVPYGSIPDSMSGWSRGNMHGYDPVQGYLWPGTRYTTLGWADGPNNTFSWSHAVALYKSGYKAEAYECVGHLIHLLSDLSVPAHVKVVNHGISLSSKKSGTILDPDIATLVADEYEMALAGGIVVSNLITLIPDVSGTFTTSLGWADTAHIPSFPLWSDYFVNLGVSAYNDSLVNAYYGAPSANGQWGFYKDGHGNTVSLSQLGITPPVQIGTRWTQIAIKSTASVTSGAVMPKSVMISLCNNLVPRAVEYSAGLLLKFFRDAANTNAVHETSGIPPRFRLGQNFPNPFNPVSTIPYHVPAAAFVRLKIFNLLGEEVATLVNAEQPPGDYHALWNGSSSASGVYFYRLDATTAEIPRKVFIGVGKMLLTK